MGACGEVRAQDPGKPVPERIAISRSVVLSQNADIPSFLSQNEEIQWLRKWRSIRCSGTDKSVLLGTNNPRGFFFLLIFKQCNEVHCVDLGESF